MSLSGHCLKDGTGPKLTCDDDLSVLPLSQQNCIQVLL